MIQHTYKPTFKPTQSTYRNKKQAKRPSQSAYRFTRTLFKDTLYPELINLLGGALTPNILLRKLKEYLEVMLIQFYTCIRERKKYEK